MKWSIAEQNRIEQNRIEEHSLAQPSIASIRTAVDRIKYVPTRSFTSCRQIASYSPAACEVEPKYLGVTCTSPDMNPEPSLEHTRTHEFHYMNSWECEHVYHGNKTHFVHYRTLWLHGSWLLDAAMWMDMVWQLSHNFLRLHPGLLILLWKNCDNMATN